VAFSSKELKLALKLFLSLKDRGELCGGRGREREGMWWGGASMVVVFCRRELETRTAS
jgi:hypothetical protein